ncbi:MAG: thiolase family protein [Beutenbergiaceae bacterium]
MPVLGRDVVLIDAVRTPFGRAKPGGLYAHTRSDDLAVATVRELVRRHQLPLERIGDIAWAAATQTGDQGLTLGRMIAILAGLPHSVPGLAIDRMCAGALTATTMVAGQIAIGAYDLAIAGGVEHMGRHPLADDADPNPRLLTERLIDPEALTMGATAENLHDRFPTLTRARANAFAAGSQTKYAQALADGRISPDLVPVAVSDPERGWGLATADEPPRPGTTVAGMIGLPTPFRPGGAVTAATSSPLTDGAAAAILSSSEMAAELGITPRMRLVSHAYAGVEPEFMGLGPVPATQRALALAGLTIDEIGAIEINEAFAVQVLAFLDAFDIADDDRRVNAYGGAIAIGHPLAASGIRLMMQLARRFEHEPAIRYGITTMCVGLGQGGTAIWENPHHQESEVSA